MSSGLGTHANVGRCYFYYEDFAVCLKTNENPMGNCGVLRDDYLECLHNRKERTRKETIRNQEILNIQAAKDLAAGIVKPVAHGH